MSFAWATVALLVFLLPGFLFLTGLFLPEQFTRETGPRSPLGQLASIVLISVLVHGILYYTVNSGCQIPSADWWVPRCPDLEIVLAFFQLEGASAIPLGRLATSLSSNWLHVFGYVILSSVAGLGMGYLVGLCIVEDRLGFRMLAQHPWIFRVQVRREELGTVEAHILTRIAGEGERLLYSGRMEAFGLAPDGSFSYVVLANPRRSILKIENLESLVHEPKRAIGSPEGAREVSSDQERLLFVRGTEIENVFFKTETVETPPRDTAYLLQRLGARAPTGIFERARLFGGAGQALLLGWSEAIGRAKLKGMRRPEIAQPEEAMHQHLKAWLPDGAQLFGPTSRGRYWRWRVDFKNGKTVRLSFAKALVQSPDGRMELEASLRTKRLENQGGNYRVEPNQLLPDPPEWSGW